MLSARIIVRCYTYRKMKLFCARWCKHTVTKVTRITYVRNDLNKSFALISVSCNNYSPVAEGLIQLHRLRKLQKFVFLLVYTRKESLDLCREQLMPRQQHGHSRDKQISLVYKHQMYPNSNLLLSLTSSNCVRENNCCLLSIATKPYICAPRNTCISRLRSCSSQHFSQIKWMFTNSFYHLFLMVEVEQNHGCSNGALCGQANSDKTNFCSTKLFSLYIKKNFACLAC